MLCPFFSWFGFSFCFFPFFFSFFFISFHFFLDTIYLDGDEDGVVEGVRTVISYSHFTPDSTSTYDPVTRTTKVTVHSTSRGAGWFNYSHNKYQTKTPNILRKNLFFSLFFFFFSFFFFFFFFFLGRTVEGDCYAECFVCFSPFFLSTLSKIKQTNFLLSLFS